MAEGLSLDVADVYEALVYYHRHLGERTVEERRQRAAEAAPPLDKPE